MAESKVHGDGVTGFMLRTAEAHQEMGHVRQAISDYLYIIRQEPDTKEAREAYGRLVRIAQDFEAQERLYAATDLFRRIQEATSSL